MNHPRAVAASLLVVALAQTVAPAPALAQTTVDGSAEWTVVRNENTTNTQSNQNGGLWQNYALGYTSSLWDPRLVRFNAQGLFRTSSLTSQAATQQEQRGRQGDLGYMFGASLFQASALPFFIQGSRTTSTSTGQLGPSNPVRSGMIVASGAPPLDFESLNKLLNLGWQLNLASLPHVELGYRRGSSVVTGGDYQAAQTDDDRFAVVEKDSARARQSFRYQHTAFANVFGQTFVQQLNNLDYDLSVLLTAHTRVTAHGGRHTSLARSEFASTVTDAGAYTAPPSLGAAGAEYALAGIAYEPSGRFSLRLNGDVDRQVGAQATTSAKLVTAESHVEVVRGLRLTGSGTSGARGQIIGNVPITVVTQSAVGGAVYQASVHWLSGTVGATRGLGTNVTPEGLRGTTQSWSREADLSTTFGWFGMSTGYERARNRDDILDFGNYDSERVRASAQTQMRRLSLSTSADQLRINRGLAATLANNVQRTFSGAGSLRLWHESIATATAGGFDNNYTNAIGTGRDQTWFWGLSGQSRLLSTLRVSAWMRKETAMASQTGFDQRGINAFAGLEYRLRTLNFALEYRQNQSLLRYLQLARPDDFRGRQFRVTITRQFGFRLR